MDNGPDRADFAAGDSPEQRQCELVMLEMVSEQLGCPLVKTRVALPNGSVVEVDGCSDDRSILCEAWAHQGPPKSAQKMKVITDAAKLFVAGQAIGGDVRLLIVFGDRNAAAWFQGRSWMAEALRVMGVEILVLELGEDLKNTLRAAQARQYR